MTTAYKTTTVPVSKSQEAIRKLLINFGARGVQFSEDFSEGIITVRFAKMVNETLRTVSVSMRIPEPPKRIRHTYRNSKSLNERKEQMARATLRALHDWLKAQFVAVDYGLMTFEDVFLSHFEWMLPNGERSTVGEIIRPRLELDTRFLLEPTIRHDDITDGIEVTE